MVLPADDATVHQWCLWVLSRLGASLEPSPQPDHPFLFLQVLRLLPRRMPMQ